MEYHHAVVSCARRLPQWLSQACPCPSLRTRKASQHEFESPGSVRRVLSLRASCLPGEPCPGPYYRPNNNVTRGQVAKPPRPWLGAFSAENNGAVVVMSVAAGGPAAKAGLRQGDIISDVRDGEVDGLADFYRKLWQNPAGAEIPLRVVRDGRDTWLRVKSADRNSFLKKPHLQ